MQRNKKFETEDKFLYDNYDKPCPETNQNAIKMDKNNAENKWSCHDMRYPFSDQQQNSTDKTKN